MKSFSRILMSIAILVSVFYLRTIGTAQEKPVATAKAVETTSPEVKPGSVSGQDDGRYRIGPGDVLEIRLVKNPDLSRDNVRVDQRGMVRMPMIDGDVQAACLTESELAANVARLYMKYKRDPSVDVFVKEYNSKQVAVIGAVNDPGRFQLQRRVRLLELLAYVKGPTDKAGKVVQVVHTPVSSFCSERLGEKPATEPQDDLQMETFKLADTLQASLKANPYIEPGDIVRIPDADQAYVVGNVKFPMPIPLRDPVSVSRAIAMAGGPLEDSRLDQVVIVRQTPGSSTKTEIPVDLKAITKHKAEDIALLPNDIVNVPISGGKRMIHSLLGSVAPAISQLPVRVVP